MTIEPGGASLIAATSESFAASSIGCATVRRRNSWIRSAICCGVRLTFIFKMLRRFHNSRQFPKPRFAMARRPRKGVLLFGCRVVPGLSRLRIRALLAQLGDRGAVE